MEILKKTFPVKKYPINISGQIYEKDYQKFISQKMPVLKKIVLIV